MVDYICWIGRHYTDIQDRRTQYVVGFQYCHAHENSLLERMLEGTEACRACAISRAWSCISTDRWMTAVTWWWPWG